MNIYNANTTSPRPESYRKDVQSVSSIKDESERKRIFNCISSMA